VTVATYVIDEARLTVPDGWNDRSLTSLEYPTAGDGALRLIMTRQLHRDRSLSKAVDEALVDMRRRLAGFELVEKDEILLDGQPAIDVRVRFMEDGKQFDQRSLWLLVGPKCITIGVLSTTTAADAAGALFERVRGSLRRRTREDDEEMIEAAPPIPPAPPMR
jgi:hypothetical protein